MALYILYSVYTVYAVHIYIHKCTGLYQGLFTTDPALLVNMKNTSEARPVENNQVHSSFLHLQINE